MTTTFKQYWIETVHSFSSTQINLPKDLAKEIIAWGKTNIPDKDLFIDHTDATFGREKEIHVTVLYGLHTNNYQPVEKLLKDQKQFTCELGKISIFENVKFDVVKIDVYSSELHRLNKLIKDNLLVTSNHNTYKPHVTIAYIKKGKAAKLIGDRTFKNKEFLAQEILFSNQDRDKTPIALL